MICLPTRRTAIPNNVHNICAPYAPRHPLALIWRCCHLDILHTLQVISFSMYMHHCTFSCRGGVTQTGIITVAKCSQNLQKNLWRVDAEMCVSTASWSSTVALVRMFRVPSNLTSSECPSLPQFCQHNKTEAGTHFPVASLFLSASPNHFKCSTSL